MKQVTVTVSKQGVASIETSGFQGNGCTDIIEGVTRALGAQVVSDDKKPEFFVEDCQADHVRTNW
jgi:hypothetical protein